MSFIFTNTSGYQQTIDRLKSQVAELVDETTPTPIQVFKTASILDYTFGTLSVVNPISTYPLFLITVGDEEPVQSHLASDISFICYMCFNDGNENYGEQVNQIFSKLKEIFNCDHSDYFVISGVIRSNTAPELFATNSNKKPFWCIQFTVTAKQLVY